MKPAEDSLEALKAKTPTLCCVLLDECLEHATKRAGSSRGGEAGLSRAWSFGMREAKSKLQPSEMFIYYLPATREHRRSRSFVVQWCPFCGTHFDGTKIATKKRT